MQYHVTAVARCHACPAHWRDPNKLVHVENIYADDMVQASDLFQTNNRLCLECLREGVKAKLTFNPDRIVIYVADTA